MKIRYNKLYYKVGIKDFIIIKKEQLILILKRLYRYCKRAINSLKSLIIVILLSIIYIIITYFWGNAINKNISINDVIWDSRELIFSSLIIVFVVDFSSKERQRRQNLKEQKYTLDELILHSEVLLKQLTACIGIKYEKSMLLSKTLYDQFKDKLDNAPIPNKIIINQGTFGEIQRCIKDLKYVYKKIIKNINNGKYKIGENDYKNIYANLNNDCNRLQHHLVENYPADKLKNEISSLSYDMLLSCAYIRRIWMWDYEKNQKIRTILLNHLQKDDDNYYEVSKWF